MRDQAQELLRTIDLMNWSTLPPAPVTESLREMFAVSPCYSKREEKNQSCLLAVLAAAEVDAPAPHSAQCYGRGCVKATWMRAVRQDGFVIGRAFSLVVERAGELTTVYSEDGSILINHTHRGYDAIQAARAMFGLCYGENKMFTSEETMQVYASGPLKRGKGRAA